MSRVEKLQLPQANPLLKKLLACGYDPFDPPLAEALKSSHNLEGRWAVLTPVYWQATHNDAMILAAGRELDLSEEEAQYWFQKYAEYLAADSMTLIYHDRDLWLLCIDNKPDFTAKPVHHLLNHSLMPELERLDPSLYWQKFITESQMFFASIPNTTRLNGVWIWGNSRLKDKHRNSLSVDGSNSNFLVRLWRKFTHAD